MDNYEFEYWCNVAVRCIKYRPDRQEVKKELYEHLEDRYDSYLAQGMKPEEAQDKAMQSMGSPEAIAPQLAAIHRPFWGYLLDVSKWVLAGLTCVTVIAMLRYRSQLFISEPMYPSYNPYTDTYYQEENYACRRIMYDEPDCTAYSDGYTFTLSRVAWWREFDESEAEQGDDDYFFFQIEVTNPRPWAEYENMSRWFRAEDSLGNYYYNGNESAYSYDLEVNGNFYRTGLFTYTQDMWFRNFSSQDAEWIDLHYDRAGRDIVLRIDLTGGGEK